MIGNTYADVVSRGSGSHDSQSLRLIRGDGDCMFHAIAEGVGGGRFDAQTLRFAVVGYERANRAQFEPFIPTNFEEYLNAMAVPRVLWGTEPELMAAASVVEHRIIVWRDGRIFERYGSAEDPEIHLRYSGPIDHGHYDLYLVPPRSPSPQPSPVPRETQAAEPVAQSVQIPHASVPRRAGRSKKGAMCGRGRGRGRGAKTLASHKEAFELVLGSVGRSEAVSAPVLPVAEATGSVQDLLSAPAPLLTEAVAEPEDGCIASFEDEKPADVPSASFEMVRRGRARGRWRGARRLPPGGVHLHVVDSSGAPAHSPPQTVAMEVEEGDLDNPESEKPCDEPSVSTEKVRRGRGRGRHSPHSADATSVSTERDRRGRGRGRGRGRRARRRGRHSVPAADVDASTVDEALAATFMDCADSVNDACPPPPDAPSDSATSANGQPNLDSVVPSRHSNPPDLNRVSFLTRAMLEELEERSASDIVIKSVQTDLVGTASDLNGPWAYRDSTKVIVTYLTGEMGEARRIIWSNLCKRGFCDPSRQSIVNPRPGGVIL